MQNNLKPVFKEKYFLFLTSKHILSQFSIVHLINQKCNVL